ADAQQIDELGDRAGRVADGADGQRAHDPCDRKWNRVTIMPMARPNAAIIVPTRRRAYTRGSPSSGGVAWAFGGLANSTIPPTRRSAAATSTRIKYTVFSIAAATIIRRGAGTIPRAPIFVCSTRAGSGKERRCPRPDPRRNCRVCAAQVTVREKRLQAPLDSVRSVNPAWCERTDESAHASRFARRGADGRRRRQAGDGAFGHGHGAHPH